MKFANLVLTLVSLCLLSSAVFAQKYDSTNTVQLVAEILPEMPAIQLKWVSRSDAIHYLVYRKPIQSDNWSDPIVELDKNTTNWLDKNIEIGKRYNYKVERVTSGRSGTGYILSGIQVAENHNTKGIIVLVDTTAILPSNTHFHQYLLDLENEGWHYYLVEVDREDPPPSVKLRIQSIYKQNINQITHLVLIGHVSVPYSGAVYPDGHGPGQGDHHGAWPADTYYADLDGNWTDRSTTVLDSADPRNLNKPEDGKFDNYSIPDAEVELGVGRIDFANLPVLKATEQELLERYFNKNHAFRTKQFTPQYRGLIQNNFKNHGEGYGQNGLKNFTPMFGEDKITYDSYSKLNKESYIWAYAAGGGSYNGINSICTEQDLLADSLQAVFMMHFGSYFGDWDHAEHNFLRAVLASGTVLTNCWVGRPNWFFYPMAMGETIGYCTELSMSNKYHEHAGGFSSNGIHMALMGDPTLRMYVVAPPKLFSVRKAIDALIFSWEASKGTNPNGYYLYKKTPQQDTFQLAHPTRITDNVFRLPIKVDRSEDQNEYMLKAVELTQTASGSFYNLSAGVRAKVNNHEVFPVELIGLKVKTAPSGILLNWSTVSEKTNLSFEIQRSRDAKEWEKIGFVEGNSTTLERKWYDFIDSRPTDGNNYYRLRQVDVDGDYEYSKIKTINWNQPIRFSILPNPTKDWFKIEGKELEEYDFQLIDALGHLKMEFSGNTKNISIKHLPNGIYTLIARKGKAVQSARVIKQ